MEEQQQQERGAPRGRASQGERCDPPGRNKQTKHIAEEERGEADATDDAARSEFTLSSMSPDLCATNVFCQRSLYTQSREARITNRAQVADLALHSSSQASHGPGQGGETLRKKAPHGTAEALWQAQVQSVQDIPHTRHLLRQSSHVGLGAWDQVSSSLRTMARSHVAHASAQLRHKDDKQARWETNCTDARQQVGAIERCGFRRRGPGLLKFGPGEIVLKKGEVPSDVHPGRRPSGIMQHLAQQWFPPILHYTLLVHNLWLCSGVLLQAGYRSERRMSFTTIRRVRRLDERLQRTSRTTALPRRRNASRSKVDKDKTWSRHSIFRFSTSNSQPLQQHEARPNNHGACC